MLDPDLQILPVYILNNVDVGIRIIDAAYADGEVIAGMDINP